MWYAGWNCTSYVARKRPDVGKALREEGGWDAHRWWSQAAKAWLKTGKKPAIWAVGVQYKTKWRYYGHVGIVVSFTKDEVCMNNANVEWRSVVSKNCFDIDTFSSFIY